MSKEAMTLALEAVKELHSTGDTQLFDMVYAKPVIKALEEALAKQEQSEPKQEEYLSKAYRLANELNRHLAIAPAPQPAQKPLTRDDLWKLWCNAKAESEYLFWWEFARAIEAAHGIKENT